MENEKNSVTFDVTLPSGISALFTIRNNDKVNIKELLDTTLAFDKALLAKGIKPHVRSGGGFPKKEKEFTGELCPKDGGRLYHLVTKSGKDMCKCEHSTFIGGVAGGCDFVAWGKNLEDAQAKNEAWKKTQVSGGNGEAVNPEDIPF